MAESGRVLPAPVLCPTERDDGFGGHGLLADFHRSPVDETGGCVDGDGLGCEEDGGVMAAGSESDDMVDGRVVILMVFTSGGDLLNERTGSDRCEVVKPYPCALVPPSNLPPKANVDPKALELLKDKAVYRDKQGNSFARIGDDFYQVGYDKQLRGRIAVDPSRPNDFTRSVPVKLNGEGGAEPLPRPGLIEQWVTDKADAERDFFKKSTRDYSGSKSNF